MAEKGYRFLKISARVFNVAAWLFLAVGLVFSVINATNKTGPWEPRLTAAVLAFIWGCLLFFIFGALSGLIHLLLSIESRLKS